mgnify:FL=1
MALPPQIRAQLPRLRPLRAVGLVIGAALLAVVVGQLGGWPTAGRALALALLPLLVQPTPVAAHGWRPGRDALHALAAGLLVACLCQWVWAPGLLAEGETTGSDVAEWFWTLHSLSNPSWEHFSANRYPLAPLLVRLLIPADNAHDAWYAAAIASMGITAAGLWLWGRAVAGPTAGWAAALMVGALPDLVVMCRSVTGYPEVIAAWTLAGGLAAYALRRPGPWTCLLAGLGCGACFSVDPRGLVPGVVISIVALLAAALAKVGWRRRLVYLALVLTPLYGSWVIYSQLPTKPRPLEGLLATSVQVSYHRMGQEAPYDLGVSEGWIWGRSQIWEIPATVRAMREASGRLNPAVAGSAEQRNAVERNVLPFASVLACLAALALLVFVRPVPPGAPSWRARLQRLDWQAGVALLPLAAHAAWFANTVQYEYYTRYFALAMPGVALLMGLGMSAPAGRRRPAWLAVLPVLLLLWVVPSNLNVRATWRGRGAAQRELQLCLAAARGQAEAPSWEQRGQDNGLFECVAAQSKLLDEPVRWPW